MWMDVAGNPTLLLGQQNTEIGVLVEDDVYRNQLSLSYSYHSKSASLSTSHFGLDPNASYTMEWSIYLLSPPDYWDFINLVRKDLGVNFTVEGPFYFSRNDYKKYTLDQLKEITLRQGWKIVGIGPFFEYYDGAHLTKDDFAGMVKPAITKLKEVNPNAVTLFKLELPLIVLNTSQLSKYVDSIPVLQNGELSLDPHYQYQIQEIMGLSKDYGLYDAYVTLDNERYKELKSSIDFAMDECGFGGVYFDSFTGYTYGTRYTYDRWDNHTVDVDPENFTIIRKYATLALITGDAMKSLVEYVQSKGGIVVANLPPPLRSMRSIRFMGFTELNTHVESPYVEKKYINCSHVSAYMSRRR